MSTTSLAALPVCIHPKSASRKKLDASFELMLRAADKSVEASMAARRGLHKERAEGEGDALARTVLNTIGAITNERVPTLATKSEAVKWSSSVLFKWRDEQVRCAVQAGAAPGLDAETVSLCMTAITQLSKAIS